MSVLEVERWQSSTSRSSAYTATCGARLTSVLVVVGCFIRLPARNRALERVWDMKYFCFVKAARLRWGEEAGSFIREVRPGYPLLPCRVFTQRAWSDTETVELFCWRSPTEPMCFTVSDTDHTLFCSVEAASIGFVIVIDRRRDKWSSVKASLTRIAVNIYFCALIIKVI